MLIVHLTTLCGIELPTAAAAKGSRGTALQVSSLSLLALRQTALKYQADTAAN